VTLALSGRGNPAAQPAAANLDLREIERQAAIAQLFHRNYAQFVRLAVLLGADEDAEDIVEEAFCALHQRWHELRDPGAALPYLRATVHNLTFMRLRHLEVARRHYEELRPDADSAESIAVLREDQREVLAALWRLTARQRQALVLRYWLGLREAEVAHTMGISAGAVKAHTSRGLAGVKRILETQR
jgi:RNA polymerase sigma factor (sigma-70 family)